MNSGEILELALLAHCGVAAAADPSGEAEAEAFPWRGARYLPSRADDYRR